MVGYGTEGVREYKSNVFYNATQGIEIELERQNTDRVFIGILTRKVPIRRLRHRTKQDGIKYGGFIYLLGSFEHVNDTSGSRKCREIPWLGE